MDHHLVLLHIRNNEIQLKASAVNVTAVVHALTEQKNSVGVCLDIGGISGPSDNNGFFCACN